MANAAAQAVIKRSSDAALMLPPPPPKRQKRPAIVLDEEEYSQAVSDIIARDYFPGLQEVRAQSEYLEAMKSKNKDWIREAGRNLTQVMTPGPDGRRNSNRATSILSRASTLGETPRGNFGETSGRTPQPQERAGLAQPVANISMSLTAFQAKYTSEDNESFNKLLDKQNSDRAAKYAFFHNGNKLPTPRQIAYRKREQKLLEEGRAPSKSLITTNADGDERQLLGAARPSQDLNARPASLDMFSNRHGPRNTFMFEPDGVDEQERPVNHVAKGPVQAVNYTNTRFPVTASISAEKSIPPSPSISAIDAAIAGRPRRTESEPGFTGAETPRVNGYAFVDAEPTPSECGQPVSDEEADAAEQAATMQLLPRIDKTGPNPFHISESSKREDLHRRLVEKADAGRRQGGRLEQLRNLGITPGRTPTPKFASSPSVRKATSMTPAAKRLAGNLLTPQRVKGTFDQKSDWTPASRKKAT